MSIEVPGQYYSGEGYEEDEPQVYEGATHLEQPIPVVSVTENFCAEFGACMTWPVGQAGVAPPTQILTRRTRRSQAKITITALSGATSVVFNSKLDPLTNPTPTGATYLAAGRLPDWESQQPLYAIAIGGTATVVIQDETYAER
jgi:hypothetical protein